MTLERATRCLLCLTAFLVSWIPPIAIVKLDWIGTNTIATFGFVILPLAVSIMCLASLKLSPSNRLAILITGTAAVVGVYIAEIYVSTSFDKRPVAPYLQALRRNAVPNAVAAIFPIDLIKRDGDKVTHIIVDSTGAAIQPLSGIPERITVQCIEDGREIVGWIREKHDQYGFNNPDSVWQHEQMDIVFVGDSFTHSECVPRDHGLVAPTRNRFPRTVNLSAPGNGPLLELGALIEYGAFLRPRIVVWVFYENDIEDLKNELASPLLCNYLTPGFSQRLIERRDEIARLLDAFHERSFANSLAKEQGAALNRIASRAVDIVLLRHIRRRFDLGLTREKPEGTSTEQSIFDDLATVLNAAVARVAAWNGKLIFVYLPSYNGLVREHKTSLDIRRRTLDIVHKLGLTVVDVTEAFARHPSPHTLWQCEKCHYTSVGFAIAGEHILNALERTSVPR